jgi:hypothetical protein
MKLDKLGLDRGARRLLFDAASDLPAEDIVTRGRARITALAETDRARAAALAITFARAHAVYGEFLETTDSFPRLARSPFTVLEGFTDDYNCVGLAIGERRQVDFGNAGTRWADALAFFARKGCALLCEIPPENLARIRELEVPSMKGVDVIALHSKVDVDTGVRLFTHAVRQHRDGGWISKMSDRSPAIRFRELLDLAGGIYGNPTAVLVRPSPKRKKDAFADFVR